MRSVLVYLSTFNGEKYLDELIKSVLSQTGVNVFLHIRDDHSTDDTKKIILSYAKKYPKISYEFGDNLGYAKSFWHIFSLTESYDYYAFCDQDDVWKNDKLFQAVSLIEKQKNNTPVLYYSDAIAVDSELHVIKNNAFQVRAPSSKFEALQHSMAPGCTFVFNFKLFEIAKLYSGYMESHDWTLAAIAAFFGNIVADNHSYILYRLHGDNAQGWLSKQKSFHIKVIRFFKKPNRTRSRFAKDFLNTYKNHLNSEDIKAVYHLGYYRINHKRLALFFDRHYHGFMFHVYILLGRV